MTLQAASLAWQHLPCPESPDQCTRSVTPRPPDDLPLGPAPRPPPQPLTGLFQASTQPLRVRSTQFCNWGSEAEAGAPRGSRSFFLVQAPPRRLTLGGSLASSAALQVGPALGRGSPGSHH